MAFFQDSLLRVSWDKSRQEINRLKRGRKPSPWPTEALTVLPASSQKWVCGTETTLLCIFLHTLFLGTLPWSDPARKHTQWIERYSRCNVGAFPAEQRSADTTVGSRRLPWKLGDKNRTNLLSCSGCSWATLLPLLSRPWKLNRDLSFSGAGFQERSAGA